MYIFANLSAKLFFLTSLVFAVAGLVVFMVNVVRRNDTDYETGYPWSLRLSVYFWSPTLWFIAIPVGAWFLGGRPSSRKFARGLLWIACVGVFQTLATIFGMRIMIP